MHFPLQVLSECEKLAQASSQGIREQLAEVEAEASHLRQNLIELRVLNSLSQENALRLEQSMDALKRVMHLLVQDHQAEVRGLQSALGDHAEALRRARAAALEDFLRVAREALPDHGQVLEALFQGLMQGMVGVLP